MTFVAALTTDSETFNDPAWAAVEREIRALDARTHTTVTLAPAPPRGVPVGDAHLCEGGGGGGRYIVYLTEDNQSFWNLTDPSVRGSSKRVLMNIGGQEGDYRESQFVSLALALRAARQYFTDGQRAADLDWDET